MNSPRQKPNKPVCLLVFAKAPQAGLAKTRLIPALGAAGAAQLAARMLDATLEQALAAGCATVRLCVTPALTSAAWAGWQPPAGVSVYLQEQGDLGERMVAAVNTAFADGFCPILLGTDCPQLDTKRLREAAAALSDNDLIIHGTADGGYALLGLSVPTPELFQGIRWSTDAVFSQTLQLAQQAERQIAIKATLHDIDDPNDLIHLPPEWTHLS